VTTAEPAVAGNLAGLLAPGGRLTLLLSVVERDGVDGVARLDDGAARALGRRFAAASGLAPEHVTPVTAADARRLHSTWAARLGVGRTRPAWRPTFRG
jgi:hypothetical protein